MIINNLYPERLKPLEKLRSRYLHIKEYISFDTETTGLSPYQGARIFSYCYGNAETGVVEVRRLDDKNRVTKRRYKRELQALLDDTSIAKIAHNYKFDYTMLISEGYRIPKRTVWHCTLLMSQLLQNLNPSHSLDYLVWELIGKSRSLAEKVYKQAKARGNRWDRVDKPLMHKYQVADGTDPLLLFFTWHPVFIKDTMLYLDYLNEIQLVKATVREEQFGVNLHWKNSNAKIIWLEEELESIQKESYSLLGKYVNFNSHPQVSTLLFKRFKYPIIELDPETHQASTDKKTIIALKEIKPHRVLDLILMYRSYSSALSMLRSYQVHADPEDGTIHPIINPNEASTGRQSSENPNMQNIRKGRVDESNPYAVNIRDCFMRKSGYIYCFGDYSAIEMKLIIEAAKSMKMIDFMKKGINPHIIAANIFYGKHLPKSRRFISKAESKALYDYAKNGHFCLAYGGGPEKFATTLKLPLDLAMPGLLYYQEEFPEIAFLSRDFSKQVERDGFVKTPFGRKLYLPRNKSYAGLNYFIQGTAAGILKRAQVAIDTYLQQEWDDEVRMVLPIHDELIIAIPRYLIKYQDEILYGINRCMVEIPFILVPLEVEWKKSTTTWDNTIPFPEEWHKLLHKKAA
jgi:DNA polymerase-1